jgi:hypothetical protein
VLNFEALGFKVGPSSSFLASFQLQSKMVVLQGLKPPFVIGVGNEQFQREKEGPTLKPSSWKLGMWGHSRLGYYFWDKGLKDLRISAFIMIYYII